MRHLLLTPPPDFVAERNARVKALRAEGRRDEAALVALVRRPSWTEWALNRTADDHPDAVAAFAAAAEAMREAQAAAVEGRSAEVGVALRALRERTADIVKLANSTLIGAGRPADVADLTERAAAVAADALASERLLAGVLRADDDAVEAIRGLPDPTVAARGEPDSVSTPPARGATRSGARRRRADEPVVDDAARAATQAAERRRTMRELAESERAQRTAAHELARAERAVVDAEAKRAAASEAVDRAQRELTESEARLSAAGTRRATLAHEVEAADHRAAALRDRLARLADD